MGRDLFREDPVFRRKITECDAEIQRELGWPLLDYFASDRACPPLDDERIQPTVTALQIALAEMLRSRGIFPAAVAGLSMGELAATVSAGALTLEDAIRVACCEARLTREEIAPGRMAFVHLSARAAGDFLAAFDGRLSLAIELGPEITVVSGDAVAVTEAMAELEGNGIPCRLSRINYAFHTPHMLGLERKFLGPLQLVNAQSGSLPIYSSLTGGRRCGTRFDEEYWWQIVHRPALFRSAVESMLSDGYRTFVEVGPHPILLQAVMDTARQSGKEIAGLSTLKRNCGYVGEPERFPPASGAPRNV